jgi:hypothetical protein
MTSANTAADLDVFMAMINQACAAKLKELDGLVFISRCLGQDDGAFADRRQRLIDLPGAIKPGTREELASQWPADFPPLSWAFVAHDDAALALGLPRDCF